MDKSDIAISLSCFEDISLVNYYTHYAKKVITKFVERDFIVYVHTNNPDEFKDLDCRIVPSNLKIISVNEVSKMTNDEKDSINFDEYWTFYKKIEDIDYVLDRHDYCLHLDSDNLPTEDTFNKIEKYLLTKEWNGGIYFSGTWGELNPNLLKQENGGYYFPSIGYLKSLDYFDFIDETDQIDPSLNLKPFDESCIFVKKFDEWDSFKELVLGKYQTASINNDKKNFPWIDDAAYTLFARGEGLGWAAAVEELGISNKAKSDDIILNIRKTFVVKNHPGVSKKKLKDQQKFI